MLLAICFLLSGAIAYCQPAQDTTKAIENQNDIDVSESFDTTITMPEAPSYKLLISVNGDAEYYPKKVENYPLLDHDTTTQSIYNATMTYYHDSAGKKKILAYDSLYIMNGLIDIQFEDYNNDKVKDILIFNTSGARANSFYYLYLVDHKNKKLIRVKGFEDIPNPQYDGSSQLINSYVLSGRNYFATYRLTSKHTVVEVGKAVYDDELDEDKPKKIKKKKPKK